MQSIYCIVLDSDYSNLAAAHDLVVLLVNRTWPVRVQWDNGGMPVMVSREMDVERLRTLVRAARPFPA